MPIHFQSVYVPSTDICPILASHKNNKWKMFLKKKYYKEKSNDSSQSLNRSHHMTNFNGDKKFTFLGYLIIKPVHNTKQILEQLNNIRNTAVHAVGRSYYCSMVIKRGSHNQQRRTYCVKRTFCWIMFILTLSIGRTTIYLAKSKCA